MRSGPSTAAMRSPTCFRSAPAQKTFCSERRCRTRQSERLARSSSSASKRAIHCSLMAFTGGRLSVTVATAWLTVRSNMHFILFGRALLTGRPLLEHLAGDHDLLHLARALIDAQRANLAVKRLDLDADAHAVAAEKLHRAIDHALRHLGRKELGAR